MTIWQEINAHASSVVEQVAQSVVQIVSDEGNLGAGTIWSADGFIMTNAHVVMSQHKPRTLTVVLADNRRLSAKVVAVDETHDLALLEVDAWNLTVLSLGDSLTLVAGQYLMALGHPWGMVDALTAGIVIGVGNNLPEADQREWIALDMKMRPGHSGGALFTADGQLVGINTMIRGPEVSFAVPVNVAKTFLQTVLKQYQRERAVV